MTKLMGKPSFDANILAVALLEAQHEAETFFKPYLEEWLKLEVAHIRLNENEAKADFHVSGFNASLNVLEFSSHMTDEYIGSGEYETYYGQTIEIPLDFFDDPTPYVEEATKVVSEREEKKKKREQEERRLRLVRLQTQLNEAKKEFGLDIEEPVK